VTAKTWEAAIPLELIGARIILEAAASRIIASRRLHRLGKGDAKIELQFERVVKALRADSAARPAPPRPKL
jgi:hypothetical protein